VDVNDTVTTIAKNVISRRIFAIEVLFAQFASASRTPRRRAHAGQQRSAELVALKKPSVQTA
jgi:hypothetical protein